MAQATTGERVLVFIPAYRCAEQIGRVLAQVDARAAKVVHEVIVVDNQSPDGTPAAAVEGLKRLAIPGRLLRNCDNYNLGGSQKVAFDYAAANGFDYVVVLHGDDQADLADLVPRLEAGEHREVDAFLGSRFARGARLMGYSGIRTAGNIVFNGLFSLAAGRLISDLGSGLNLYRVDALRSGYFRRFADELTFNYYLILAHAALGQRVRFFPISWREEDQVSSVRIVSQTLKMLRILQTYVFTRAAFLQGEHRAIAREAYPSEVIFENDVAIATRTAQAC